MRDDTEASRAAMLARIGEAVASHGYHVTLVQAGVTPRFAYTIGMTGVVGHEITLPGAISLYAEDVKRTVDAAVRAAREDALVEGSRLDVPDVGTFGVVQADASWVQRLLLGVSTYYRRDDVEAVQLVPQGGLRTIDVPDMSETWDPERHPVWQWLERPWSLEIPPTAVAMTNLEALRGAAITEAARWEENEWEMFAGAGPDVRPEDVRAAPLATLLAHDPSLEPVIWLEIGQAIHREPPAPWRPWGPDTA
jgi:Domain of unknown function (DUF4262)